MNNPRAEDQQKIKELSPTLSASYTQKRNTGTITIMQVNLRLNH